MQVDFRLREDADALARPVSITAVEGETVYSDSMRLLFPVFPFPRLLQLGSAMLLLLPGFIGAAPVMVLKVEGVIVPASADFIGRGLRDAEAEGASLIVLRMDAPRGLDSSMRQIAREILAFPVPPHSRLIAAPSSAVGKHYSEPPEKCWKMLQSKAGPAFRVNYGKCVAPAIIAWTEGTCDRNRRVGVASDFDGEIVLV